MPWPDRLSSFLRWRVVLLAVVPVVFKPSFQKREERLDAGEVVDFFFGRVVQRGSPQQVRLLAP